MRVCDEVLSYMEASYSPLGPRTRRFPRFGIKFVKPAIYYTLKNKDLYSPIDVDCSFRSAGLFLKIANAALLKIFMLMFCNSLNILQARINFAFMTVSSKQESLCDFAIELRHACRFSFGYTAR